MKYDADEILARMRGDTEHPWVDRLMNSIRHADIRRLGRDAPLTPFELRVLICLSHGSGYQGAADLCGVSIETIKQQAKDVRRKLRAKNTVHAVANAFRRGLIR